MFKKRFSANANTERIILCLKTYLGVRLPDNTTVHTCTYENESVLETKLNELCEYIFGDTRKVHFKASRDFPYLEHTAFSCGREACLEDAAGQLTHYTVQDYWFLWLTKQFLRRKKNGAYVFIDVDWLRKNAVRISKPEDKPMSEMHADYLFW